MATEPATKADDHEPVDSTQPKGIVALSPYLGPALALLLFTFIVARVLVVARFDRTTALGIITEGGTAPLVVGTVMYNYPLASLVGLLVLLVLRVTGRVKTGVYRSARATLLILFTVSGPVTVAILNIALLPLYFLLVRCLRSSTADEHSSAEQFRRTDKVAMTYVGVAMLFIVLTADPWMPAERLAAQGQPAVTGYVLKSSPETTVVLLDSPRRLVRVDGKVARHFCLAKSRKWYVESVPSVVFSQADYPRCKDIKP